MHLSMRKFVINVCNNRHEIVVKLIQYDYIITVIFKTFIQIY